MGKVVWICPRPAEPSGGCAFIHQLAQLCVKNGVDSYVWQEEPFKLNWLANGINPEVIKDKPTQTSPKDLVIVPEVRWLKYQRLPQKKICFIQNTIWIENLPADTVAMTCSDQLNQKIKDKWGINSLGIIHPYLEDGVWYYTSKRLNHVVLFARRNDTHPLMKAALEASGYTVSYITGPINQRDLAALFAFADYYVHLATPEGFPLVCAEAMRSRCVVVGTTGGGGQEFMTHRHSAWVTPDEGIVNSVMLGLDHLKTWPEEKEYIRGRGYAESYRYTEAETTKELLKIVGGLSG